MSLAERLALREMSGPRKLAIGAATLVSFVVSVYALFPSGETWHPFLLVPTGGLFFAMIAAQLVPLSAQLFARAMQWSNLGLGFALAVFGSSRERGTGTAMAVACGVALLVLGDRGLTEAERRAGYVPAALRPSLLLLMVLALADAQSFLLFGLARLDDPPFAPLGLVLLVAAALLVVGFVLLARLSLVGVVVDTLAAALVLVASLVPGGGDGQLRFVLGTLAVVHLVVAIPTLVAASRGQALEPLGPRARTFAARAIIVAVMLASTLAFASH